MGDDGPRSTTGEGDSLPRSVISSSRLKDSPFYNPTLENLSKDVRELLENHGGIEPEIVVSHVEEIRDKAWAIYPYPCVGMFRFIDLNLSSLPLYPAILSRLKDDNQTFLDLGCCLGTDIRQLVADGVPGERLYGSDLRPEFWDLGYALFSDKDRLGASFLTGDVFDPASDLRKLDGIVDIVHAGLFFHLFSFDQQIEVAKRTIKLMRPVEGSLLVGLQVGHVNSGILKASDGETILYRHNEESWARLWREVSEQTGVKFVVESHLGGKADRFTRNGNEGEAWLQNCQRLKFSVRRV